MALVAGFPVFQPFLDVAGGAETVGGQAGQRGLESGAEVGVEAEDLAGGDAVGEEFADEADIPQTESEAYRFAN